MKRKTYVLAKKSESTGARVLKISPPDEDPVRHVVYIEPHPESLRRGGSTRTAMCICGWKGPQRSSLELAVDDALLHEGSDHTLRKH